MICGDTPTYGWVDRWVDGWGHVQILILTCDNSILFESLQFVETSHLWVGVWVDGWVDLIEIFQFCLQIYNLWRYLHAIPPTGVRH